VKLLIKNKLLAQLRIAQAAIFSGAFAVVTALLYFAFSQSGPSNLAAPGLAPHDGLQLPQAPSLLAAGGYSADAPLAPSPGQAADVPQADSLANTQADGDWSIGPNGQAKPSEALRRRFDYLLLQQGEVGLDSVAQQIRQQVQKAHGALAAQQIMVLWDSYLRLQQQVWTVQVNPQRPGTWAKALAERVPVRRQLLGDAWADAFYSHEENELRQLIAQANSGLPASTASAATAQAPALLPDAAQRTAEHEAQWRQWDQRLDAARARVQQLRSAPELSDIQRQQAIVTYLVQQFNADEMPRVNALLRL
jgi:lipase chaperone LimK